MDERLSDLIDAALRWHAQRAQPGAEDIERCWPALAELLQEIGRFARAVERTESLHADDPMRQLQERALAAERLYGRLVDPPRADNVVSMPAKGIGRVLLLESRTT